MFEISITLKKIKNGKGELSPRTDFKWFQWVLFPLQFWLSVEACILTQIEEVH